MSIKTDVLEKPMANMIITYKLLLKDFQIQNRLQILMLKFD